MGSKRRRWPVRVVIGIGIAAAIGVVIVPLVALVVLKSRYEAAHSAPTTPLFTAADLQAPPPDEDNGWWLVHELPRARLDDVAHERLQELLDPSATLHDRVAVYDRAAGTLRIEAERNAATLDVIERALARPRFADACPMVIDADCDPLRMIHMPSEVALRAVAHASAGRLPEALLLATDALRAYLDLATTARRIIPMAIATIALDRTLVALEVLVHLATRAEASPDWRVPRDALRAQLVAWPSLDVQQAIRGEYVVTRASFESLHAGARGRWSMFALDPHATSAAIDAYYGPLHDYAGDPSRPAPADATPSGDIGWWQPNSLGELFELALLNDLAPRVRMLHRTDEDLRARARALLRTLPAD